MTDETCEQCGRVDHPAYMCWRVGHLPKPDALREMTEAENAVEERVKRAYDEHRQARMRIRV